MQLCDQLNVSVGGVRLRVHAGRKQDMLVVDVPALNRSVAVYVDKSGMIVGKQTAPGGPSRADDNAHTTQQKDAGQALERRPGGTKTPF